MGHYGVDSFTVFSAPKYCDSTENKGAYINIGSQYKLEYHQFDAVEHPPIRPMVCLLSTLALLCTANFDRLGLCSKRPHGLDVIAPTYARISTLPFPCS
jgi:hypothetical protein